MVDIYTFNEQLVKIIRNSYGSLGQRKIICLLLILSYKYILIIK